MGDLNFGVIIPAAGSGTRLGAPTPKQYLKILDKPLLIYSLEAFLEMEAVKKIALVVDSVEKAQAILQEFGYGNSSKILLVKGQGTRHRSIKAGLQALKKYFYDELKLVVVQDGARPLVPTSLVMELVRTAEINGAAGAVRPLVSTVLQATPDNYLEKSLDRSIHVASEMPQAFQFDILACAYNECSEEDLDHGTECLALVQKYSKINAKLVPGPEDLWKVTYKKDLRLASAVIKQRSSNVCIISKEKTAVISALMSNLSFTSAQTVRHVIPEDKDSACDQLPFNIIIFFHHQKMQDNNLLNFLSKIDSDNQKVVPNDLLIHVILNANVEDMKKNTVYDLQQSARNMFNHYKKLQKGVVVIYCISGNGGDQLISLINTLVESDPLTFSSQTFFI